MARFTDEDDALLDDLGVAAETKAVPAHTAREERIIAGFEDIQRFVDREGRLPQHGEAGDIFERLYAVRLDRLREQEDCRTLLAALDHQGLLAGAAAAGLQGDLDDDALLAELGVEAGGAESVTHLRHVRPAAEKKAAEEIGVRQKCEDFARFRPAFDQVQDALTAGSLQTRRFERKSEIEPGRFYVLAGQKAYVAAMEAPFINDQGKTDARLRVVFDNRTESNLLMRSLQKALQQDPAGRRIVEPTAGPLFATDDEGDETSGTVYVLRSRSNHPAVVAHRDILHKIGVTGGDVEQRIGNARLDPTFLMADVEVVATYMLFGLHRTRLENLVHRIFAPARLDIEVIDRFGQPVAPREWFLVPRFVIDEAIGMIRDGTIAGHVYDPNLVKLVRAANPAGGNDGAASGRS